MTTIIHRQSIVGFIVPLVLSSCLGAADGAELWLHPKCKPLPTQRQGPFVRLPDGGILGVDVTQAVISRDEGKTWETHLIFKPGQDFVVSRERAIVCTKTGTVIVGFMNYKEKVWKWNAAKRDADPGTKLPTYVVRSTDGGKTWLAPQKMHDTWTGDARDMIQTASGRVVFSSMNLLHNPGRHSVLTYVSNDDGKTWTRSNTIDLGGNGHHGGVTEATFEQLRDGRIWMLIRTNWERFWGVLARRGAVVADHPAQQDPRVLIAGPAQAPGRRPARADLEPAPARGQDRLPPRRRRRAVVRGARPQPSRRAVDHVLRG